MILYQLKSAIHYLWSSRRFTLLNIIGLALGLSLAVMMVMLIHYELSFDKFHPNRNVILQVIQHDLKSDDFSTNCPLATSIDPSGRISRGKACHRDLEDDSPGSSFYMEGKGIFRLYRCIGRYRDL